MKKILQLILFLVITHSAGIIGSIFTTPAIKTWYAELTKPSFTPPDWLFAPAWLVLYTLMGIAIFLIWQKGLEQKHAKFAFTLFFVHLALNILWSILFFGFHNVLLALVDIVAFWFMIIVLIKMFWPLNKLAAYLLVPYLLWVSFAMLLNFSIWQLN